MGRKRNTRKQPRTTITVDEDVILEMVKRKKFGETWTSLVRRVFENYRSNEALIEENQFLSRTCEEQMRKIAEYVETLESVELKNK